VKILCSPTLHLTDTTVGTKKSHLDSSDQITDLHWSNVHCTYFLAQASLFLIGVLLLVVSLQQFNHKGLLHAVSSEQLMLRCLVLELCEAFTWAAISEAGNSNELNLCSRGDSGSSFLVLVRASFIIALDGFLRLHLKKLSKFLKYS
jgi:hypothetical protein